MPRLVQYGKRRAGQLNDPGQDHVKVLICGEEQTAMLIHGWTYQAGTVSMRVIDESRIYWFTERNMIRLW